ILAADEHAAAEFSRPRSIWQTQLPIIGAPDVFLLRYVLSLIAPGRKHPFHHCRMLRREFAVCRTTRRSARRSAGRHKSGTAKLVGGVDARLDGSALRPWTTSYESRMQFAGRSGRAHAGYSRRRILVRVAEVWPTVALRHRRLPGDDPCGRSILRITNRHEATDRATLSRPDLGRCDLPDHAGPFCKRRSYQRRTRRVPWF